MIKKLKKINHYNKQKYEIKYRDYNLLIKIIISLVLLWLLSGIYYQLSIFKFFKTINGNNSIIQNKNFYYLIYVHGIIFSNLIFLSLKTYSNEDYFWKVRKKTKYLKYIYSFIPSLLILYLILFFIQGTTITVVIISSMLILLSNFLALNVRILIRNNILYLSTSIVMYVLLSMVVKIPNWFSFINIDYVNVMNLVVIITIIINILLSLNNISKKSKTIDFKLKKTKKYKSKLDIYFLNILRSEKVIPISLFIFISIIINSYILKKITSLKMLSISYDYIIQISILYFMSNITFSLNVNSKFKKYFQTKLLLKKIITFNVFAIIFFLVALVANNIDFSLFVKNVHDKMYFFDSLIVITSIMLGSQIGTLIYQEKTIFTSALIFVISLVPTAITIYIDGNKKLYVIFAIIYWILAHVIILIKEKYEKYI